MRKFILFLFPLCIANCVLAQFEPLSHSARCQAMGGASVAVLDFAGCNVNPATLGWRNSWNVAIDYRQMFVLKGMSYKSVAVSVPTGRIGSVGLYYTHFGDRAYNEQSASAHYGIKVSKHVSVGVGIYYLHSGTDDGHYERFNSATGSVGVRYSPNERLAFGAAVYNPFFVRRDGVCRIPVQLNIGAVYCPLKPFLLTLEFEKNLYDPLRVRMGAEYCLFDRLLLQVGFATSPIIYSIGVGYSYSHISANICVAVHQYSGVTPGLTIGYSF